MGKVIGMSLRADIPLPMDLLPLVWRNLLQQPLSEADLEDADWLWFQSLIKLRGVHSTEALDEMRDQLAILVRGLGGIPMRQRVNEVQTDVAVADTESKWLPGTSIDAITLTTLPAALQYCMCRSLPSHMLSF